MKTTAKLHDMSVNVLVSMAMSEIDEAWAAQKPNTVADLETICNAIEKNYKAGDMDGVEWHRKLLAKALQKRGLE